MKIAPLLESFKNFNKNKGSQGLKIECLTVHTGQHYDDSMSKYFFNDLGLNEPDFCLNVGSGTHAEQTGRIMIEFERVCFEVNPDLIVVVGDVNSTIACALVAAKLLIPVAHVEAGLRSFDRTMPEEINRILTDRISDFLFTTCEDAAKNLLNEGIPVRKIHFVGNVMIDALRQNLKLAEKSDILHELSLKENGRKREYAVLTLHRPSNVDEGNTLKKIFMALDKLSGHIPVVFPAHPRTLKMIEKNKFQQKFFVADKRVFNQPKESNFQKILLIPPLSYLDFLCLMANAKMVLTDSGGIQEETTFLGIPCLTLRKNTERPITVREGTNIIVGTDPQRIFNVAIDILKNVLPKKKRLKYWDGKTAYRIVKILTARL